MLEQLHKAQVHSPPSQMLLRLLLPFKFRVIQIKLGLRAARLTSKIYWNKLNQVLVGVLKRLRLVAKCLHRELSLKNLITS